MYGPTPVARFFSLRLLRGVVAVALVSVALVSAALTSARAAIVSEGITFQGPQQSLNFSADTNGTLTLQGSGTLGNAPFLLSPNPQTSSVQFSPNPSTWAAQPVASAAEIQIDNQTGQVQSLSGLSLTLFGGAIETTHLQEIGLSTIIGGYPATLPIDATFAFQQFGFNSLGGTVTGDHFSFTGTGSGLLDMTLTAAGIVVAHSFGPFGSTPPVTVTGTISTSPVPGSPHNENIILDGTGSVTTLVTVGSPSFMSPISVNLAPLFTFNGGASANIPINFGVSFHFEADPVGAIVPERATAALLILGLVGLGAGSLARRRVGHD